MTWHYKLTNYRQTPIHVQRDNLCCMRARNFFRISTFQACYFFHYFYWYVRYFVDIIWHTTVKYWGGGGGDNTGHLPPQILGGGGRDISPIPPPPPGSTPMFLRSVMHNCSYVCNYRTNTMCIHQIIELYVDKNEFQISKVMIAPNQDIFIRTPGILSARNSSTNWQRHTFYVNIYQITFFFLRHPLVPPLIIVSFNKACLIVFTVISYLSWLCYNVMYSTAGYERWSEMRSYIHYKDISVARPAGNRPLFSYPQNNIIGTQCCAVLFDLISDSRSKPAVVYFPWFHNQLTITYVEVI